MKYGWKPIEYKFILLGDSSVGKSSIFKDYQGNPFLTLSCQLLV